MPTPTTETFIPAARAAFAASSAPPSWLSPSVMMIIDLPISLRLEKAVCANSIASAILVPCAESISGETSCKYSVAERISFVIGS